MRSGVIPKPTGPPQSVQNRMSELVKTTTMHIFAIEGSFVASKRSLGSVWGRLLADPGVHFRSYLNKFEQKILFEHALNYPHPAWPRIRAHTSIWKSLEHVPQQEIRARHKGTATMSKKQLEACTDYMPLSATCETQRVGGLA